MLLPVASICGEDWGRGKLLFDPFSPSFTSPPLPLNAARGQGSDVSSSNGVWGGAPAEIKFCTFYLQNLTASGNDSNDLPENQLAKFKTGYKT